MNKLFFTTLALSTQVFINAQQLPTYTPLTRASILQTDVIPYLESQDCSNQVQSSQEQLREIQSQLDLTESELDVTQEELAATTASYLDALVDLESTQEELVGANSQIDEAELLLSATAIPDASAIDASLATLFSLAPCTIDCASYNPNDPLIEQINNGLIPYLQSALANIGTISPITQVSIGLSHIVVLTEDGGVYAAGNNNYGQLGLNFEGGSLNKFMPMIGAESDCTAIAAGGYHTVVLKNGTVYAAGYNAFGQLGLGYAGSPQTILISLSGEGVSGCTAIAAGNYHTVVLKNDKAYATGRNNSGELGIGTSGDTRTILTAMIGEGISGCTAIAAGSEHTVVLKNDQVYATGRNNYGQLGIGNIDSPKTELTAMIGEGISDCTAIAAGGNNTVLLKNNIMYGTGDNAAGQLGTSDFILKTTPTTPKLLTFN